MSDLTRAETIENLEDLSRRYENAIHDYYGIARIEVHKDECEAVKVAIDSLKNDSTIKEAYDKGYKDGQEALAFHLELCKEEGSVVTVPDGTTNGDVIKALFPDKELWQTITSICLTTFDHNYAEIYKSSWWNSPYRKEKE